MCSGAILFANDIAAWRFPTAMNPLFCRLVRIISFRGIKDMSLVISIEI